MATQTMQRPVAPSGPALRLPRQVLIAALLAVALLAFEIFNFDTTQYALADLLGPVSFLGMKWATILAVAFCAIDFAGLARIFTPEEGREEPKEVWYLMGAWLLGALMNAVMTWWAVSLTLLSHQFGNEVLSRQQLLTYVPFFVAALVLLTRILFIGALSVAGERLLTFRQPAQAPARPLQQAATLRPIASPAERRPSLQAAAARAAATAEPPTLFYAPGEVDGLDAAHYEPVAPSAARGNPSADRSPRRPQPQPQSRPNGPAYRPIAPQPLAGMQAQSRK